MAARPKKMVNRKILDKQSSLIEFRRFKEYVELQKDLLSELPSINELSKQYSLHVDLSRERAVQVDFGLIPIDHLKDENKFISEKGGCLVYSMGSDGRVITVLYPAKSDFSRPFEDNIIIRFGFYSGFTLERYFEKDLRDLSAYTMATRVFGEPNLWQKMRVFWLRRTHPLTIDGEYRSPKLFGYVGKASNFTFRTMIVALMKPIGLLVVISILIVLGLERFIPFISN